MSGGTVPQSPATGELNFHVEGIVDSARTDVPGKEAPVLTRGSANECVVDGTSRDT
jgi:hypothetical protein